MNVKTRFVIPAIITVVVIGIFYYITIPPINIKSVDFWWFVIWCLVVIGAQRDVGQPFGPIQHHRVDSSRWARPCAARGMRYRAADAASMRFSHRCLRPTPHTRAARRPSAGMLNPAAIAGRADTSIIPAATGIAHVARRGPRRRGSPHGGARCCRCRISIWCSPCPTRSTA